MKSVLGFAEVSYIEKKSRFIGLVFHTETIDEVNINLEKARNLYPGANHYTYAYILSDFEQKASDDGEPSRTAGYPILEVIKNQGLNDVLVVVIRYFGGILLGAGGLIRAYSHTAALALENSVKAKKITTVKAMLECDYENLGNIDRFIREQTELDNVEYDQIVKFYFSVSKTLLPEVKDKLFNFNNYQDRLVILNETESYVKADY
ncbi:MAG: YigZ family protein [Candidatus Izemoplasmatales bacterium]